MQPTMLVFSSKENMLWRQVIMPWRRVTLTVVESSWLLRSSRFAGSRRNLQTFGDISVSSQLRISIYIHRSWECQSAQESYIPESGPKHNINVESRKRFPPLVSVPEKCIINPWIIMSKASMLQHKYLPMMWDLEYKAVSRETVRI